MLRCRIASYELQALHRAEARFRSRAMLGAYGLDDHLPAARTELPESLVVALQVASEPWDLAVQGRAPRA